MFRSSMDRREEYPSLRPAAIRFRRQKYRTGGDRTRPRRVSAKKQHPKRCCFLLPKALPDRHWPRPLPFVPKTENSRTAESGYSINFFQAFNHEIDNQRNRKEIPKASFPFTGIDATVLVKYFTPWGAATWLITEAEQQPDGDWMLYGYCTLGYEWEWGTLMLSELQALRGPFGLTTERDLYIGNNATVAELAY